MISIDNYLELQVVGILLLVALTPLLNILMPSLRNENKFCSIFEDLKGSESAKFILVLVVAFVIGVEGNRLIDDFIDDVLDLEGKEEYATLYKSWADKKSDQPIKSLKVAEYKLGNDKDAEMTRNYFERHKFLMRILRGTAFSALLFLVMMILYRIFQSLKGEEWKLCKTRYTLIHYVIALMVLILFSVAYRLESTHYYKRVCELQTGVSDCELKIN